MADRKETLSVENKADWDKIPTKIIEKHVKSSFGTIKIEDEEYIILDVAQFKNFVREEMHFKDTQNHKAHILYGFNLTSNGRIRVSKNSSLVYTFTNVLSTDSIYGDILKHTYKGTTVSQDPSKYDVEKHKNDGDLDSLLGLFLKYKVPPSQFNIWVYQFAMFAGINIDFKKVFGSGLNELQGLTSSNKNTNPQSPSKSHKTSGTPSHMTAASEENDGGDDTKTDNDKIDSDRLDTFKPINEKLNEAFVEELDGVILKQVTELNQYWNTLGNEQVNYYLKNNIEAAYMQKKEKRIIKQSDSQIHDRRAVAVGRAEVIAQGHPLHFTREWCHGTFHLGGIEKIFAEMKKYKLGMVLSIALAFTEFAENFGMNQDVGGSEENMGIYVNVLENAAIYLRKASKIKLL